MSVESPTDERAWHQVLQGDEGAFAAVWDRHFSRVVRHLQAAGNSSADAEELAALAFLEAWRRRRHVRFVNESIAPWLILTAQNVHRNAARSRRRYAALLARIPLNDTVPDPAFTFEDQVLHPELMRAIATLNPAETALLVLIALEGVPIKDAAHVIGVKESTARMRLARLRKKLRTHGELQALAEGELQ